MLLVMDDDMIDILEEFKADLADALCHDCENGVKWLNEQALEKFIREYPNLYKCINL